jgi:hypothetical protein
MDRQVRRRADGPDVVLEQRRRFAREVHALTQIKQNRKTGARSPALPAAPLARVVDDGVDHIRARILGRIPDAVAVLVGAASDSHAAAGRRQ